MSVLCFQSFLGPKSTGNHVNDDVVPNELGIAIMNIQSDVLQKVATENEIILVLGSFLVHMKGRGDMSFLGELR